MLNGKSLIVMLALVALMFGGFVSSASAAVTIDDLLAQIAALQAQLAALQGSGGGTPHPIIPNTPIFESHGNATFEDNNGAGWWNLTQYDGRAQVNIGAYSTERIVSMQKSMTVDKYDPSMFSFSVSMRTLDTKVPTGALISALTPGVATIACPFRSRTFSRLSGLVGMKRISNQFTGMRCSPPSTPIYPRASRLIRSTTASGIGRLGGTTAKAICIFSKPETNSPSTVTASLPAKTQLLSER